MPALFGIAKRMKPTQHPIFESRAACALNGQTEGQISRLKALKRATYGRAGLKPLRARMLSLEAGEGYRE
jgi:transposase